MRRPIARGWRTPYGAARGALAVALASPLVASPAERPDAVQQLPAVSVVGHYDNGIGTSDAASEGSVRRELIEVRPILRTGELLEFVPGLIVTQHSGDGKANQYFLRGFNLDHGTDFATSVDGMPVNMRTHAHGQGYSDLNFVIPELVARIDYRKGPYFADDGDFASAGSARFRLLDSLDRGIASVTVGEERYARTVLAQSFAVAGGRLLAGLELGTNNGPWDLSEQSRRASGLLRYSRGDASEGFSITAMAYGARWRSTDQIPQRAVDDGRLGRFGAIDPSDGGRTSRGSLSMTGATTNALGALRWNAYAIASRLNLYSNFTYFLDDPVRGDQFEQAEHRKVAGFEVSQRFDLPVGRFVAQNTVGLTGRFDRLSPVGLYRNEARERFDTTREDRVREGSVGVWLENRMRWSSWLQSVAGVRYDAYRFSVDSSVDGDSGRVRDHVVSPKLSLVFGPWARTEFFVNYGQGFHSNDARGATATAAPATGDPILPAAPLVKSHGEELGVRSEWVPGLQTSLAFWRLQLASELVFSGDAGDTEPSRASRRRGIELNNHYALNRALAVDLDLSFSKARYTEDDPVGNIVPGSIEKVVSFGATYTDGPWSGHVQTRYFGPRPLVEDGSVRSKSTTLTSLRVARSLGRDLTLSLDVFNLFDRKASDIDYYYPSRLPGEPPEGVNDIHFHPVEPRSARVTLTARF